MYENYRVLFVDDEQNILNTLRRALAEEEYYCHFASSGKEALEIIGKEKIALIVTDMRMPEMSGLELLNKVTEASPLTVKVVLSGYTQLTQVLATINQVDIYKFITKPWELPDLIKIIRKSLDYYIIEEEHAYYKSVLEAKNQSYQNILKRINEVIDEAKKNVDILGMLGKAMLGFGKAFTPEERRWYYSIFMTQETLFELFSQAVTVEKEQTDTEKLMEGMAGLIRHIYPDGKLERFHEAPLAAKVNVRMLETAVNALNIIFYDEFQNNGLYSRLYGGNNFKIVFVSPKPDELSTKDSAPSVLKVKIGYVESVLGQAMELCGIKLQVVDVKGNLVVEILPDLNHNRRTES